MSKGDCIADTLIAKSDQLNAVDLMAGPVVVTVKAVRRVSGEQPVAVDLQEFPGKPFMPCKSMRRLLAEILGSNVSGWLGRSLRLYRDPAVQWGGEAVGGIRVDGVSGITEAVEVVLPARRGKYSKFRVEPLGTTAPTVSVANKAAASIRDCRDAKTLVKLRDRVTELWPTFSATEQAELKQALSDCEQRIGVEG